MVERAGRERGRHRGQASMLLVLLRESELRLWETRVGSGMDGSYSEPSQEPMDKLPGGRQERRSSPREMVKLQHKHEFCELGKWVDMAHLPCFILASVHLRFYGPAPPIHFIFNLYMYLCVIGTHSCRCSQRPVVLDLSLTLTYVSVCDRYTSMQALTEASGAGSLSNDSGW